MFKHFVILNVVLLLFIGEFTCHPAFESSLPVTSQEQLDSLASHDTLSRLTRSVEQLGAANQHQYSQETRFIRSVELVGAVSQQEFDSHDLLSRLTRSVEQEDAASPQQLDSQESLPRITRSAEQHSAASQQEFDSQETLSRLTRNVEQQGAASQQQLDSQEIISRRSRSPFYLNSASDEHFQYHHKCYTSHGIHSCCCRRYHSHCQSNCHWYRGMRLTRTRYCPRPCWRSTNYCNRAYSSRCT